MAVMDALFSKDLQVGNFSNPIVRIKDFYKNRNVLITGATGFLGKALLEKLLRSCDDIGTIYAIIRRKKGKTIDERLQELLALPVFERLHTERPDARNKVIAIEGDICNAELRLSKKDQKLIEEAVSVVFHSAATIKFDEQLKYAVNVNIRGTKHIIDLARNIKNLKAFIYVSTAYSNSDRRVVEEVYYPPKAPKDFWKDLITAAEKMNEEELNALTPSIIGNLPNTYTFTKQIAESLVHDHRDLIPLVIYRPTIVTGAFEEPFPGWVDNVNGPTGMMLGYYTGAVNIILADPKCRLSFMGVDYVVNGIIAAAWERSQNCVNGECLVYNASSAIISTKDADCLFRSTFRAANKIPAEKCIWKPKITLTKNFIWYYLVFVLFNLVPALLIDIGIKLSGSKFRLHKIYRKIYVVTKALSFFSLTTLELKNEKWLGLHAKLPLEDKEIFNFSIANVVGREGDMVEKILIGIKKYILKEDTSEETVKKLRKRLKYYAWADMAVKAFWLILVIRLLIWFYEL